MQHPFITDLSDKTMEELSTTIQTLNSRLAYLSRTYGNHALIGQMRMALDSYNAEYGKRMDELYKKQNLNNQINISNDRPNSQKL